MTIVIFEKRLLSAMKVSALLRGSYTQEMVTADATDRMNREIILKYRFPSLLGPADPFEDPTFGV